MCLPLLKIEEILEKFKEEGTPQRVVALLQGRLMEQNSSTDGRSLLGNKGVRRALSFYMLLVNRRAEASGLADIDRTRQRKYPSLIGRFGLALDNLVAAPCGRCKLGYTIAVAPMESRRSQ